MTERIYKEQPLCLDFDGVHLRIPDEKVWIVLLRPVHEGEPVRYLELSPITRRPIVDCDERRLYKE